MSSDELWPSSGHLAYCRMNTLCFEWLDFCLFRLPLLASPWPLWFMHSMWHTNYHNAVVKTAEHLTKSGIKKIPVATNTTSRAYSACIRNHCNPSVTVIGYDWSMWGGSKEFESFSLVGVRVLVNWVYNIINYRDIIMKNYTLLWKHCTKIV